MEGGRQCSRCGAVYPPHLVEVAFQFQRSRLRARSLQKRICRACEQTGRDHRKRDNRWRIKARDVIRSHARNFGIDRATLMERYGWEPRRLIHDAAFQYGNGCNYCGMSYREMGHGPSDITLDIVDRSKPPYYRTNTRWCCQTCNRKKSAMTPEAFELDRQMWRTWRHQQEAAERDPHEAGLLF